MEKSNISTINNFQNNECKLSQNAQTCIELVKFIIFIPVFSVEEKPLSKEETSLLTKVLRAKLVASTKEVEVQRKDPSSPLYSVKSFEELPL